MSDAADPIRLSPVDVLVVGSGVAGLSACLEARALGLDPLLVTSKGLPDGGTRWAQGGISVVLDEPGGEDSVEAHVADTVAAGGGLCDEPAVRAILSEGPAAVHRLRRRGAVFDRGADGGLALAREGGHSAFRVIQAGGDATGAEIQRTLVEAARTDQTAILPHHTAVSLCVDERGVTGAQLLDDSGNRVICPAGAVVLATGGMGGLYACTTNPPVANGAGLALALRAGATLTDVEFMQFHPTALATGPPGRQLPLVTEAVRGAGGVLVDGTGAPVMAGLHPLADVAPRDVVASAVARRMADTGTDHVWLDATGLDGFAARFPTVHAACRGIGVDPAISPIPVTPAAHYLCGGVVTDTEGRTTVPGLYAVGEVARTGLHGANRLASNSLLEGLVTGTRAAQAIAGEHRHPPHRGTLEPAPVTGRTVATGRLRRLASTHLALGRDAAGLAEVTSFLDRAEPTTVDTPAVAADSALVLVARALAAAALQRTESRGCHIRRDFPATDDGWRHGVRVRLTDPPDELSLTAAAPVGAGR